MKIRSYAKINLGIEVLRKREDSYHEIRTLFQSIGLFDELELVEADANEGISIEGDDPEIEWDESNLIFRAARVLRESAQIKAGVKIRVRKKIPPGKGLGGGSSNAAMTLFGLNRLWGLSFTNKRLKDIGEGLGADVPYFLEGGLCLGLRKGDHIIPQDDLDPMLCLVVLPDFAISTAFIYKQLTLTSHGKDSKIIRFLGGNDFRLLQNELEETVFSEYPQLKTIKRLLIDRGAVLASVSGTGSAVYGLFPAEDTAKAAARELGNNQSSVLIETLSRERYWNNLITGV
ncbi:4-(cytidine 5'-diphospho)-2-C-methyl-D-erythritol kinase [Acidobacteriota bacterium]